MSEIADKTTFLFNYSYLFRGPLFYWDTVYKRLELYDTWLSDNVYSIL